MSTEAQPGVVLIADDDLFTRTLLTDVVRPDGHKVLLAATAKEALELLADNSVDVALVDLILPDMDGLLLLDKIRSQDPAVEVIVCTASKDADNVVAALRGRAFDYLVKPVVPAVVQRAVSRALHARRLLGENLRLRRALDLVQAGQRLLAATELTPLMTQAMEALVQLTGSTHGAVGTPGEAAFLRGFDEPTGQAALAWAHKQGLAAPDFRPCAPPPDVVLGPCQAISLGPPGVVALIARGPGAEEYSPHDLEAVQFLMRHIHLALHNHVRFATVSDAARRDSLTGLLNAQVMQAAVAQAVTRASREGNHCAVVFLDLDGFKQVNDVHGHLMGSRLLVELAGILGRSVRDCDVVSRFGGDEFVILLTEAPEEEFMRVAGRLRARVDGHTFLLRESLSVHVTVSLGLAVFPADGADATELMRQADMAMYKAKNAGKNAVVRANAP